MPNPAEQGQPDPNAAAFKVPVEGAQGSVTGADANAGRQYDHLFAAEPLNTSVAIAASGGSVERPVVPAQTSHREGYWAPPTAAQVEKAARYGFDLSKQAKYHSADAWENRG